MSSAWSQLEQMLTCAICLDKFKNPRLLPCQHSFCGDACMDGLVDYARRQIKCPECRAEHRIPYQGVQSLPLNVTLIRFLELHARITGEEPEPVPTFMEKCSICGEKVEGVQRCAHCDKKVCPECKEAHLDLLRREIGRINGQSKRSLGKMHEFKETLAKATEKLAQNHKSVRAEIEDSCRRLIGELQAKQERLLEEVDSFVELEQRTIDKLQVAMVDECKIIESNLELADEKLITSKYQWADYELFEAKEIYNRTMEFVRLFDPEIGDYNRKIRFTLIPEFDALRKRLCEVGELKFGETAQSLIANSFQYCNASGQLALELCQAAAQQQQQQLQLKQQYQQQHHQQGLYGLAHSNSNTNMGQTLGGLGSQLGVTTGSQMLELPNALMRSQSDHRLASQFQARLKQQQEAAGAGKNGASGAGPRADRYGTSRGPDYETDALRSRYAPPRTSGATGGGGGGTKDYTNDLLRDWPRPSDNDSEPSFGSSIQFKSAFMRRKEKERQQGLSYGGYGGAGSTLGSISGAGDDDDDLTSEASYGAGGGSGRNVRFYDQQFSEPQVPGGAGKAAAKVFDCKEVEHAPLSGVPKLDECPQMNTRLHQLGAKALVDKKHAEEEGKRDKDLVESARQAMSRASERLRERQMSEDEIEKQKKANKQQQQLQVDAHEQPGHVAPVVREEPASRSSPPAVAPSRAQRADTGSSSGRVASTSATDLPSATSLTQQPGAAGSASSGSPATPTSASSLPGGRRSLYGQAVTEKSKRQLSSAIQDAASYSARRRSMVSRDETEPNDSDTARSQPAEQSAPDSSASGSQAAAATASGTVRRRGLRSSRSSLTKQSSSADQSLDGSAPATPTTRRRKTLTRADSSQRQQSTDSLAAGETGGDTSVGSKNLPAGSGGGSGSRTSYNQDEPVASGKTTGGGRQRSTLRSPSAGRLRATPTTTDDDDDDGDEDGDEDFSADEGVAKATSGHTRATDTIRRAKLHGQRTTSSASAKSRATTISSQASLGDTVGDGDENGDDDDDDDDEDNNDDDSDEAGAGAAGERADTRRNTGNRRSREFLPTYVNKLLDRSAQIRRDSQEQRSRGDSPQRSSTSGLSEGHHRASSSSTYSRPSASGYSSSPGTGTSSSYRNRLTYQRSKQHNDDESNNSNQSIYTTASSQRRSSEDEPSGSTRRPSTGGSSTDRTVISAGSAAARRSELDDYGRRDSAGSSSRYSSGRRDSAGDSSSGGFHSRFLARSRTSAALSSGRSQDYSSDHHYGGTSRDTDTSSSNNNNNTSQDYASSSSAARSYLSSRERFMQSAGSSAGSTTNSTGTSVSGYTPRTTVSGSGASGAGGSSAGSSSAGIKSRSQHLRSRFSSRRASTSNSSSGAAGPISADLDAAPASSFDRDEARDSPPPPPRASSVYAPKGRMLFKLGARGSEPGNFTWPRGVTIGQSGALGHEIVVADSSNHRVQVFDARGRFISEFGSYGSAPGEFDCLAGVAVNRASRSYVVSDRYNHRVQIFDMSGRFVRAFGELGREPGKFNLPWGVACDTTGSIYVCDKENHRVQVFDAQGTYLSRFGCQGNQPGQLQHPHYIAVQRGSNRIIVTDTNNHRVQVFDQTGSLIKTIGGEGSSPGEFKFPRGVAVDDQGHIVVGDSGNNRLQVFTSEGQFVKAIGTWGSAEGEFKGIEGVAVDPTSSSIYVCDRENHRIQVF